MDKKYIVFFDETAVQNVVEYSPGAGIYSPHSFIAATIEKALIGLCAMGIDCSLITDNMSLYE